MSQMKEITIDLNEYSYYDDKLNLKRICTEKDGMEQLLSFLINNNMKNSSDYVKLWKEYLELLLQWRKQSKIFEDNVVKNFTSPDATLFKWYYDFEQGELTINEIY